MSNQDIDRLVAERSLVREPFEDEEVAGYWAKALGTFADAQAEGLSSGSAFQLAYTAALQATLALLAAHGLRVRSAANHYMAFYAMQKLGARVRNHALAFDALRLTRHQSVYEPGHDEQDIRERLGRAIEKVRNTLPVIRSAILEVRPALVGSLPLPQG